MKAKQQKHLKWTASRIAILSFHSIAFIAISAVLTPMLAGAALGLTPLVHPLYFLYFVGLLTFYISTAGTLATYSRASAHAKTLMWVVSSAAWLGIAFMSWGALQDAQGSTCGGLFGSRQSCISSSHFGIFIYTFNPISVLIMSAIGIVLALNLWRTNKGLYFEKSSGKK